MRYNSLGRKGILDVTSEIVRRYDANMPIRQIAKELGVCGQTVHNHLLRAGKRRQPKHDFNDDLFSEFTKESCYWAGFLAADGNVSKRLTHLVVDLHIKDIGHLQKLSTFAGDNNTNIIKWERVITGKRHEYCRLNISSVKIVENIIDNYNLVPNKSFVIKPPEKMPRDFIPHYIRGYFDGDGTIFWNKSLEHPVWSLIGVSKELMYWVLENISLGANFNYRLREKTLKSGHPLYMISSNSWAQCYKILNWIYEDSHEQIRLDRKYERYIQYKSLASDKVLKVIS